MTRLLVVLASALLVPALWLGGRWLFDHPLPDEAMQPLLMMLGLVGIVLGARKAR